MSFATKKIFYTYLYRLLLVISNRFNNRYLNTYKLFIGSTLILLTAGCKESEKQNKEIIKTETVKISTEKQEKDSTDYVVEEIKERPIKRRKQDKKVDEEIEIAPREIGVEEEIDNDIMCYIIIESAPNFPGGRLGLVEYITKNIQYPNSSLAENIEGKVVVQFTINQLGEVTKPRIVKSVSPELDEEVLKVVSRMPKWIPGTSGGRRYTMNFMIPVSFKINH